MPVPERPPTIVITMAGRGQRFRDAGYAQPKYAIEVRGRTLFAWALTSLQGFTALGGQVIFVARAEDDPAAFIHRECRVLGIPTPAIVELAATTDGQATTVLQAASQLSAPAAPLLIYNIDTYVDPEALRPADARGDGWIPCFPGPGEGWSFARVDASDRALELREKVRISEHATIGLYWFSSYTLYAETYARYYGGGATLDAGERYVAPLYNALIQSGHPVFIQRVPASAVHGLGTPAEVDLFARGG